MPSSARWGDGFRRYDKKTMTVKTVVLSSFLLMTPLFVGSGVYLVHSRPQAEPPDSHWTELCSRVTGQINGFHGTAGVIIKDLKRGWVFEYNRDCLFPSASLIKIPIMASLYDAQSQGRVSLDETLSLQRRLKAGGSGHIKFLKSGTRFTVRQLIFKMITESDNTAANMLTDLFGMDYYGGEFLKLGLQHTNFSRLIMDLKKRNSGVENYTTPGDMADILEMIYERKLTGSDEMMEILKSQKINDRLAVPIPSGWQIGHKTGLMANSCHDVGIVFSPSGDYLVCALTSGARSYKRAKRFIREIAYLTTLYYGDPTQQRPAEKRTFWSRLWTQERPQG